MKFNSFVEVTSKIKNLPLPGEEAHFKMAPSIRVEELRNHFKSVASPKLAGVLALCYPKFDDETYLLLTLRRSYPGIHSNQISFPGGKMEEVDKDLLDTALRETEEEVGISPSNIEIVRELSPLYIPPSNFKVSPFFGISRGPLNFQIQEEEVENLVEVPVHMVLDPKFEGTTTLQTSYSKRMKVPVFNFKGNIVWGATAMMLSELRDLLIKAV